MFRHHKEVADVSEFAKLANMTVRSFQRHFKQEFSCSAREWMSERRAERILRELRTTDKELFEIATEFGFTAMSYFTAFCKKHLGMPPSELRGLRGQAKYGNMPYLGKELKYSGREYGEEIYPLFGREEKSNNHSEKSINIYR